MFPTNRQAANLPGVPDRKIVGPPCSLTRSVGCRKNLPVSPEILDAFLDWRARRLDDDPFSAEAWARFHGLLDPLVRSLARRSPSAGVETDEAFQEAWVVLLSHEPTGRDPGESLAILIAAVRNRLVDLGRYQRRRIAEPLTDAEAEALVGREVPPPHLHERVGVVDLVREVFEEARGRLSDPSYRIIVLRWIEERTYLEIGESLGMPVEWVRERHRRAFPVLRKLLIRRFGLDPSGPFVPLSREFHAPITEEVTS
jgi:RNA polymerase sigma factor (sigma-70 family)